MASFLDEVAALSGLGSRLHSLVATPSQEIVLRGPNPKNGTAAGFTALLVVQTNSATPLGDFSFNVTGMDARPLLGGFRIGTGFLNVYDFAIMSSPSSEFATTGGTASYLFSCEVSPRHANHSQFPQFRTLHLEN